MKKSVLIVLSLAFCLLLPQNEWAQSPRRINYQAVVRNPANNLVVNQTTGLRISILMGSASGTAVYVETQTTTTNVNGLLSVEIGGGTVVSGSLASINWASGTYFIRTEIDPTGGSSYSITGTSQLLTVPYALYAETAGTATGFGGNMNNRTISNLANPVNPQDAVTKSYVDELVNRIVILENPCVDKDGNKYKVVKIGDQIWMAENLRTLHYRNGDVLPTSYYGYEGQQWVYNEDENNAQTYGRLYRWDAVTDARNICPPGWHIPSNAEWEQLYNYLGGIPLAGAKMKSTGTIQQNTGLWDSPNNGADNSSGFNAVPAGYHDPNWGYYSLGQACFFWSTTEDSGNAWSWGMTFQSTYLISNSVDKNNGFSVRCIKD